MRLVGEQNNLENMCLFKIQMDYRILKGYANKDSSCFTCKGYNLYCCDYTPVKSQKDLAIWLVDK